MADALVAELRAAGARLVEDPARADAFAYAGEDPENAAGVADGLAREHPRTPVILPDAVTRGGVAGRLSAAARREAVLVSSAPEPGSTPALRRLEAAFREQFGREPGPYAAIGYEAMRSVLAAISPRATAPARARRSSTRTSPPPSAAAPCSATTCSARAGRSRPRGSRPSGCAAAAPSTSCASSPATRRA